VDPLGGPRVVGPASLAYDISALVVSTAVPGVAWALWFTLAWRRPEFAESLGLGRQGFWLLLPGALLASFALLPITPVANDLLAVSFAGAVFPLAVGLLTLERIAPPLRRAMLRFLAPLAAESAVLLGVVLLADAGSLDAAAGAIGTSGAGAELLFVALGVIAASAAVVLVGTSGGSPGDRAVAGVFVLTNAVLLLTFAGASATPGVGISEGFPYYLLPPMLAGVFAVLVAPWLFPRAEAFALPASFVAAGWGVVIGADVLRQPPLYGPGNAAGLYAIGGAGVLDLVYLSGFLGLIAAWAAHRLLGRSDRPVGTPLPRTPPAPSALIRRAYLHGLDGELNASLADDVEAVRAGVRQTRRLLGRPEAAEDRPWEGLAVPGWVVADTANLEGSARAGTADPREAVRAWLTARELVRLAAALSRPRFATLGQRLAAFAIDAGALGAAGAAVFVGIVAATPGGLGAVLGSIAFNAAIYGMVAVALLYFALGELWTGATLGKRLMGIEVRDRSLGGIGGLASLVRNVPLLPAMTFYALGLSIAVAIAMRGVGPGTSLVGLGLLGGTLEVVSLALFVVLGVAVAGVLGVLVMRLTAESQRVGDLWAGTWVLRRPRGSGGPPPGATAQRPSG